MWKFVYSSCKYWHIFAWYAETDAEVYLWHQAFPCPECKKIKSDSRDW